MKYRMTKKAIRESGAIIYKIGYCDLQFLLRFNNPFAYSEGVYGWSCDYYRIGGAFDRGAYLKARRADYCKVQFEWACFIDSLCKSGEITQKQYDNATF